jgi:hypothetical protein
MSVNNSDLKLYLTSVEAEIEQTNRTQSIGGHAAIVPSKPNKSLVYPSESLSSDIDRYATSLTLNSYSNVENETFLFINGELIEVEKVQSTSVTIKNRAVNGFRGLHLSSDLVYGVSENSFLNKRFNEDGKQYRCFALSNTHSTDTAKNVRVFIKQNSLSFNSTIRISVEAPRNDYFSSSATGGSKTVVEDTNIGSSFKRNHFVDSILRFTSGDNDGQSRKVTSYDDTENKFVLEDSLPFSVTSGDNYEIKPTPAQRLSAGTKKPDTSQPRMTNFKLAPESESIGIDVDNNRDHGSDLQPNDHIYLWIERSLINSEKIYNNNSFVVDFIYEA